MQLEEMEKEAKQVTYPTTQSWGSVVKYSQMEKLEMKLQEAEV